MIPTETTDRLQAAYADGGAPAALAFLNAQTDYRFTSMYLFDGDMLRNLTYYDRTNPSAEVPDDIPVEVSYCVFIRDTDRPFQVEDALSDVRVAQHPKCQEIQAYLGIPLADRHGNTVGTLCHFDVRPVPMSEQHLGLMEEFAGLLQRARLPQRSLS